MLSLTLVLLILCGGIFFERYLTTRLNRNNENTNNVNAEETYSKIRNAKISLNPSIDMEINIGGSGDETLVAIFSVSDKIYVFGNSTSSDKDMEGGDNGVFLAILSSNLSTLNFLRYEGNLVKVVYGKNGFLLGLNGENCHIANCTLDGEITDKTVISTESGEVITDIKFFDSHYAVITTHLSGFGRERIMLKCYDTDLEIFYERLIENAFSLFYVDCFLIGNKYLMFFNAKADLAHYAGVAQFDTKQNITVSYINSDAKYSITDVMPYSGGYVLNTIFYDGSAGIMLISPTFSLTKRIDISPTDIIGGKLYYSSKKYYSFFHNENGTNATVYNSDFTISNRLSAFSSVKSIDSIYSSSDYALFGTTNAGRAAVIGTDSVYNNYFGSETEKNLMLTLGGKRIITACESSGTSPDVTKNFGGSDIWLCGLPVNSR